MKYFLSTTITFALLFAASPAHAMSSHWPEWVGWPSWANEESQPTNGTGAFQLDTYGPNQEGETYNFWKHYIDVMYGEQSTSNYSTPQTSTNRSYNPPSLSGNNNIPIIQEAPLAWPAWIDEPGWMYME